MTTLHQVIAVEKGVAQQARADFTGLHRLLGKDVLSGLIRTYQPRVDGGEQLPPEQGHVQVQVPAVLRAAAAALTRMFDVAAAKEWGNTTARADVVVDGQTLLEAVPVCYLLFLEKQLVDLHTFVAALPTLDEAKRWSLDPATNQWATEPVQIAVTKKLPQNHVLAAATDKHPAQVHLYHEDVVVGYWTKVEFSGALPAAEAQALLGRVNTLARAVKYAREQANNTVVADDRKVGEVVFGYLFG